MKGAILSIVAVLLAVLGGLYQVYLGPLLKIFGVFPSREVQQLGSRDCETIPELTGCEKIVLHEPSGVVYLACSALERRLQWITGARPHPSDQNYDYVATYDPATSHVTRLTFTDFDTTRTSGLHGLDVVPSASNPQDLFVYLVNHRLPPGDEDPKKVGHDSVIELFRTSVGSRNLVHVKTFDDPSVIIHPNDVAGSSDGRSFHFTNDQATRQQGYDFPLLELFKPSSSVGFCHIEDGCKFAITSLPTNNGIVRAHNDTFYVSSTCNGALRVLERQEDNTLVLTDVISTDYGLDNLAIDLEGTGAVYAAALSKLVDSGTAMKDLSVSSPSTVLKFSINTGPAAFYGEKYKIEKVFEDDGSFVSGTTSAVHDAQRNRLFLSGIVSPWLTVCKV